MKFHFGYKTDIGMRRKQNQDNGGAFPELGLFVVADGMGGHQGGEIASAQSVQILTEFVRNAQANPGWNPRRTLSEAITEANRKIYKNAQEEARLQGMGTTTTALLFHEEKMYIGHVGDSRCYYFKPHGIWQLTRDHSLVYEKLRAGLIQREQLKTDRMRNVITRSVGFEPDVNVEVYEMDLSHGDTFLLCSDGLSGLVEDGQTLSVLSKDLFEPGDNTKWESALQRTVEDLVATANRNGGDDNVTALVVQVVSD